ncbi:MAG: hypothetical protein LQ352_004017 [Teloschistes flavicans]|nr:MAG: hypothetical protein LQ352_004017 [Teloschistes flavicans]
MARHKSLTWALALPCLLVAAVGLLQYHPSQLNDIATGWSTLVPRRYQIPANETNTDVFASGISIKNKGFNIPWTQQNPAVAPPVPIFRLAEGYILAAVNGTSPLSVANTTSGFTNGSLQHRDLQHSYLHHSSSVMPYSQLVKRQDWRDPGEAEPCSAGDPCPDKSCCGGNGKCGYGPDYCGNGCVSNCDALAMCGRYSEGGSQKCGMNLCYGFGLCHTVPPPACGGGSANGRTIGYYQASNTRDRLCDRISPSEIDIEGLTHLYFAFAKIDPGSFTIVPDKADDIPLFTAFTARKSASLQTWIAVGGFDFSDPGPTRTTWSDLVSTQGNRAAFINSVKAFMAQYGFQGVDIDWEYPATPERGGKRPDTDNFVALVKEMKDAFGGQYGLSVTLAPDYWYLRGFDAKAMEPYVDMFGFMAYDLHGFWDADLKTLGAKVRGQTDVREIFNDTLPLWFDNLDPSKINFGLAYYGRGYTLAHPSCNQLLCPFIGPSSPGPCSHYGGVLSLAEIKEIIRLKNLQPQLIEEAMMKQITWDDQWIGYDDEETTALKKKWASGYCFGGAMIWSIDFKSGGGAAVPPQDTAVMAPITAAMVANPDFAMMDNRQTMDYVGLFMATPSVAHGLEVLAARHPDSVELPMIIAAPHVYLAHATMGRLKTEDLQERSISLQKSGVAPIRPSTVFLRALTSFPRHLCQPPPLSRFHPSQPPSTLYGKQHPWRLKVGGL